MSLYARETAVSAERSRAEIEATLKRYGASAFGYLTRPDRAAVEFQMNGKRIRFIVPLPEPADYAMTEGRRPRRRTPGQLQVAVEQAVRQRWRALNLVIKAKLEAVASNITTLEQEFLAHIVLPNGQTAGELMLPRIDEAYATGKVPHLGWEG